MEQTFKVGEAAEQARVHVQTLHFYERMGLVPKPKRSAANYRLYSTDAARTHDQPWLDSTNLPLPAQRAKELHIPINQVSFAACDASAPAFAASANGIQGCSFTRFFPPIAANPIFAISTVCRGSGLVMR